MNTTQSLNRKHVHHAPSGTGFSGKVRAFFRDQQHAQEVLVEKQAPWLSRR